MKDFLDVIKSLEKAVAKIDIPVGKLHRATIKLNQEIVLAKTLAIANPICLIAEPMNTERAHLFKFNKGIVQYDFPWHGEIVRLPLDMQLGPRGY